MYIMTTQKKPHCLIRLIEFLVIECALIIFLGLNLHMHLPIQAARNIFALLFMVDVVCLFIVVPTIFIISILDKPLPDIGIRKLTLHDKLYDLIPFRPIAQLIKQIYPDQKIIKQNFCFNGVTNIAVMGKTRTGLDFKINFPFPATLVETNNSYYIDRRLQQFINVLFWGILLHFALPFIGTKNIQAYLPFGIVILLLIDLFWQVTQIEIIRKIWIEDSTNRNHIVKLSGTIPENQPRRLTNQIRTIYSSIRFKYLFYIL